MTGGQQFALIGIVVCHPAGLAGLAVVEGAAEMTVQQFVTC
jgi:hypothetical protein